MEVQKRRRKRLTKAQRRRILRRRRMKRIAVFVLVFAALVLIGVLIGVGFGRLRASAPESAALPTAEITATPIPSPTAEPTPAPTPVPTELPRDRLITITAVGDCTLGGNTNDGGDGEARFQKSFAENGADYYLQNFRALFENDDLTVANLEGPLTDATSKRSGRTFNFRGEAEYAQILSGSGVDVCTLANNHAFDFKQQGFDDTAAALEAVGVGACGFGLEDYQTVDGVTIGNLGFTEWDFEQDEIEAAVRAAKEKCDLLIVSIHWGEELEEKHDSTTTRLGRAIVDAGADLVIGNHSHIRGEIEYYNGKYIIYSLGNFCFGGNTKPTDMRCIVYQQTFRVSYDGTVSDNGINLIPARVSSNTRRNDLQPVILEGDEAEKLLKEVQKLSSFSEETTVWMPDSYEAEHGLLPDGAKIASNSI